MTLKYKQFKLGLTVVATLAVLAAPLAALALSVQSVSADPAPSCGGSSTLVPAQGDNPATCKCPDGQTLIAGNPNTCSGDETNGSSTNNGLVSKEASPSDPAANGGKCDSLSKCDIVIVLNKAIQLFSVLVGIVIAISIVIGGIQYASSAGDPQAAAAARARIRNAVIALLAYVFLYALLNFLILGGLN